MKLETKALRHILTSMLSYAFHVLSDALENNKQLPACSPQKN